MRSARTTGGDRQHQHEARQEDATGPPPSHSSCASTTALPYPRAGVPWHKKPGFKLVAVKDVRRLTGLELSELLSRQNTQRLTRIEESGAREEFVRVPVELLIEEPPD